MLLKVGLQFIIFDNTHMVGMINVNKNGTQLLHNLLFVIIYIWLV